jgi:ATP-binding cassette subfamily B protein
LAAQLGKTWPGGVELSGGQWQKLALARASMRPVPLPFILDEPTAAIDGPTEYALFEHFGEAARRGETYGAITVVVSHRFPTVRMTDLIVVLNQGRVLEASSHEELMHRQGLYAELFAL